MPSAYCVLKRLVSFVVQPIKIFVDSDLLTESPTLTSSSKYIPERELPSE